MGPCRKLQRGERAVASVAVAGHLCLDLTPVLAGSERIEPGQLFEVGPLSFRLGGSVGNTGSDLVALGVPVEVVATIGDDDLGALLRRMVDARDGMTPRLRTVQGSATSYSLVFETPQSDRTFWHHVGSNAHFDGRELEPSDDLALVHLGYVNLLPALLADDASSMQTLLARLRAAGVTTSVDLAVVDPSSRAGAMDWESILRRVMPSVDIITPSVDDLLSMVPAWRDHDDATVEGLAGRLLEWGAAVVAVSAGPRGMFLRTADEGRLRAAGRALADPHAWADRREWVKPYPVTRVATTTGAGDAATAGLLCGLVGGLSPARASALAMASAACIISGERPTPDALARIDPVLVSAWERR